MLSFGGLEMKVRGFGRGLSDYGFSNLKIYYKILSENGGGLRDTYRGLIISKNRYGIANQVLNCGFYGSVGW